MNAFTHQLSVGWIDINLTVTPTTIPLLFQLIADPSLPIRLATSTAFLRMISKGLKEPSDKLQLFKVLSLGQVLEALEEKTRQEQINRRDDTDEGEESYREALGRLLNAYGLEVAKLVDDVRIIDLSAKVQTSDLPLAEQCIRRSQARCCCDAIRAPFPHAPIPSRSV